jgi:hypothetical protein
MNDGSHDVAQLNAFIEHVIRLIRVSFNGSGFRIASLNPASSVIDLGQSLQSNLMELKKWYVSGDQEGIHKAAQQIEGQIAVARTLSVVTDKESDQLLDELYVIIERN